MAGCVLPLAEITLDDLPRAATPTDAQIERLYFSRGVHRGALPSGRTLHGSVRDYFHDQSRGSIVLGGSVLAPIISASSSRESCSAIPRR